MAYKIYDEEFTLIKILGSYAEITMYIMSKPAGTVIYSGIDYMGNIEITEKYERTPSGFEIETEQY